MSYFLSRLGYGVSLWLVVVAITFALFHIVPTDPVRTMLGPNASEEQVTSAKHNLGLDKPVASQFRDYLRRVAVLDFGRSFIDGRPVGTEVKQKLIVSGALASMTVIIVALYLMAMIAINGASRRSWLPQVSEFFFISLPTLFSGVVVALATVAYYPFTRFSGRLAAVEDWLFLLPPAFVLALYPMGILGRIAREHMHLAAQADYTRAAQARGLANGLVLRSYVLRNSLVPLLAAFGNQVPLLLTSTFVVEIVFSIPGIGALLLKSVLARDLPMLEGIVVFTALLSIAVTLLLEWSYPLADPRIRIERAR